MQDWIDSSNPEVPHPSIVMFSSWFATNSTANSNDQLESLAATVKTMQAEVQHLRSQLRDLQAQVPLEFTVCQYNLLAGYLGNNTEPWFMYGIDLSEEKRKTVFDKFYERDPDSGKLKNAKWPNYVRGILTDEEIQEVEKVNLECFAWENRRDRLLQTIVDMDTDVMSLVEMDHYLDFFKPCLEKYGYDSFHQKRPRHSSQDGCAIFWRRSKFELVTSDSMEFIDRYDPETGETSKDRCAVVTLLRSVTHPSRHIVVLSMHLARNPEDPKLDALRSKQAAQVVRLLTEFVEKVQSSVEADLGDAPVVMCGDLNATNFYKLRGLVLALRELTAVDVAPHSFIWDAVDVPSRPTSVTSSRKVRIDAIFYRSSHLELIDVPMLPELHHPIPDLEHPSDHLPLQASLRLKGDFDCTLALARTWFETVGDLGASEVPPLTQAELGAAWVQYDRDAEETVTLPKFKKSILLLGLRTPTCMEEDVFEKVAKMCHRSTAQSEVIDLESFVGAYEAALHTTRSIQLPEIIEAFKAFDTDESGDISVEELHNMLQNCSPVPISRDQCEQVFREVDADSSGRISYEEFAYHIISKGRQRREPLNRKTTGVPRSSSTLLARKGSKSGPFKVP